MDSRPPARPHESYIYRSNPAVAAAQGQRTAAHDADFFLPHLRPGMCLLDAGCGGGSITVGLAEAVAPGPVVGVDLEALRLAEARDRAVSIGVVNAGFLGADIYALPFPDASFGAVFSHHVLQHVRDPLATLREFHRVLRPGGVIGIRDPDEGATIFAPATPLLVEARELEMRLRRHLGSDPTYARNQCRLLLEAGFLRPEAWATARAWGTPELARESAAGWLRRLAGPSGGATLVALGWITPDRLTAIEEEILAWGERPDTFSAMMYVSTVAWRDAR